MHQGLAHDGGRQVILEPFDEMKRRLLGHVLAGLQKLARAGPSDLDAAEQIGLGAGHLE